MAIQVEPGEPAVLELADGFAVVLPPGAVDAPTELTARPVPPPGTPPDEWQVIGSVVDISLGRALGEPAELRLQNELVDGSPEATQVFAATFNEGDQEWVVLPTEATTDGWTAVTYHFSSFGWFTDLSDWAVGAWADLQGRRAPEPHCEGEPPDWSDSVYLSERNSPLRVCVGHDPADDNQLVVKIANNRGYGMLVDVPRGAAWVWQRGLPSSAQRAMSDYLGTIVGGIEASTTGLRYLPPGDEIHIGLDQRAVASMGHQAVIDVPTQVSIALITAIQSAISQAIGIVGDDGWVGAFIAVQTMAACIQAGVDVAHQTNVLTAAGALQTCVVNNFDAIVDAIAGSEAAWRSFGPVQGIDQLGGKSWGKRAAGVLRGIHLARAVDTLGFLGEVVSDATLASSAKQVNVYAQVQPPPPSGSYPDPDDCRSGSAPPLGLGEELEFSAMCFYIAFTLDDRELASQYADPPAIDRLFGPPPLVSPQGWHFEDCAVDRAPDSWLGIACEFTLDDITVQLTYIAYDDVMAIDDVRLLP